MPLSVWASEIKKITTAITFGENLGHVLLLKHDEAVIYFDICINKFWLKYLLFTVN